jgi:NADH-quinone oxidoreductase subunit N
MEFLTIVSYLLACTHKYSMVAAEASLKYFILGAMSSGFLLLGFVLLYGYTGLTNFFDFPFVFNLGVDFTTIGFGLLVSFALILAGFLFKLSVVPFHL